MRYIFLLLSLCMVACSSKSRINLFAVGTYTDTIHICNLDPQTGELHKLSTMSGVERPSFLSFNPDTKTLYAVSEVALGKVIAFRLDNGSLVPLGEQLTRGDDPCCIAISPDGRWLIAGNYSGGNFALISLKANGALDTTKKAFDHNTGARIHDLFFSPDGKNLHVLDLGLNSLYNYSFNSADPIFTIDATRTQSLSLPTGGARHMAYNADKEYIYTLNENSGQVSVSSTRWGELKSIAIADTVPLKTDTNAVVASAEIALSADRRYLYTSHRGVENSIVQYRIDIDGIPRFVEKFDCGGRTPRSFAIDPAGRFLIVGLQDSDIIAVMSIDPDTGALSPTNNRMAIYKPTHIVPIGEFKIRK